MRRLLCDRFLVRLGTKDGPEVKWQLQRTVCAAGVLGVVGCGDLAFVADKVPADTEIAPLDTVIRAGDATKLRAKLFDQGGEILQEAPSWAPVWSVDNPEAIVVQPSGDMVEGSGRPPAREPESTLMLWGSASPEEMLLEPTSSAKRPRRCPPWEARIASRVSVPPVNGVSPSTSRRCRWRTATAALTSTSIFPTTPTVTRPSKRWSCRAPAAKRLLRRRAPGPWRSSGTPHPVRSGLSCAAGTAPCRPAPGGNMEIVFSDGLPEGVR